MSSAPTRTHIGGLADHRSTNSAAAHRAGTPRRLSKALYPRIVKQYTFATLKSSSDSRKHLHGSGHDGVQSDQGKRVNRIPESSDPPIRAKKILIVEDSFANRDMLTRRLQRSGFKVCSAVEGYSGVAMSVSERPDLILMDVALGEMDGWQATRLIKADARTAQIPVIALTAHALASDREKSVEVGCADFDTKPVDLARLLGKIHRCLTKAADVRVSSDRGGNVACGEQIEGVECYVDD